jgi:hypothetical protein
MFMPLHRTRKKLPRPTGPTWPRPAPTVTARWGSSRPSTQPS